LAGGRLLEGIYFDWASEFQARDRDRMEKSLLELGDLCVSTGDHDDALGYFRRALELDAFREGTCLAVMKCEVRLGNRRAAMVEYERLKTLLRKELDVEPLPETEHAARQLLSGEGENGGSGSEIQDRAQAVGEQRDAPFAQARLKGVGGVSSR